MKVFFAVTSILSVSVLFSILYARNLPFKIYDKMIHGQIDSKWYSLEEEMSDLYLNPQYDVEDLSVEVQNEDFWKPFHFKNLSIPIPVRNPFFFVVPNLTYSKEKNQTKFGLSILDSKDEKISDIFFLPKANFPNLVKSQSLFSLPLAFNEIENIPHERIWNDLFTKKITDVDTSESTNWKEMVYNLYLLQMRIKLLGKHILGYAKDKTKENRGVVVLDYPDKDYSAELYIENRNDIIHSFVIISKKNSDEARIIKKKMLKEVDYIDTSVFLSDIMIKEFKSLSYVDQIDHLGMYYLLSAWSHDQSRIAILEELIFYLERGESNQLQLAPIYQYYYDRYHKVYSKALVKGLDLDPELLLKIQIMNEKNQQDKDDLKVEAVSGKDQSQTIDEQFNNLIKKTKVKKIRKSKIIRMD